MLVRASLFLSTGLLVALEGAATAQDITVAPLAAPEAFSPGIDMSGALNERAWNGTSVARAEQLLADMPVGSDHPIVRDMLRRVVLSGLIPPDGADDVFERARIAAAQDLATPDEYARFSARNPAARDPRLRAEAYIANGDLLSACDISDAVQTGRGDSVWVRIRAACHDLRDETSAADLARDILRDRGETVDLVLPNPPEGFWAEAMMLDAASLDMRMTELAGDPDPVPDPAEVLPTPAPTDPTEETLADQVADDFPSQSPMIVDPLAPSPLFVDPVALPTYDLDAALADESDQGTARLFLLGRDGDARAVAAFVARAKTAVLDPTTVLERIPAVLDPTDMALTDLPLFARYAVTTRNIPMMQALFVAAENDTAKQRIALASDAMGGGFEGRPLGEGLESALADGSDGAISDVLIALGLGAELSLDTEKRLVEAAISGRADTVWLALDHAVESNSEAETLLRVATLVDAGTDDAPLSLYRAIRALRDVGHTDLAGQLAAFEYLRGL